MNCTVCEEPISEARLRAIPNADRCIVCASKNDVPKIRRFDERAGETTVESYYTGPDTPEIREHRERLNNIGFGLWNDSEEWSNAMSRRGSKNRAARQDEVVAITTQGDVQDYAEKGGEGENDAL